MGKRVFITKKEAREIVNNLRFAYHDYGRHLGLDVKIYNFPKNIQKILWESWDIFYAFQSYFATPIDIAWECFGGYLQTNYGLDAYQEGRNAGYWGVYIGNNSEREVKRAIRKAFYYAFTTVFSVEKIRLFGLGQDLDRSGKNCIYFDVFINSNGEKEFITDGVKEWNDYMEKEIIPVFRADDEDKWKILSQAYGKFSNAWAMKTYVCDVA